MASTLDASAQSIRLGAQKFGTDMRTLGLLAPTGLGQTHIPPQAPLSLPTGFFDNAWAAWSLGDGGFHRDYSGMTLGEYRAATADNAIDSIVNFSTNWGGTTMGLAIGGAVGGLAGAMTGLTIGGLAELGFNVTAARALEADSLGEGLRSIAQHNFGRISRSQGRQLASILQDYAYSAHGRAMGVNMERLQQNILGFEAAGGFSNVTSVGEMEQVLEGVVQNARQFANKFRMTQEEAVQVMADLQRSMVVTADQMGAFSSDMAYAGGFTGMGAAGITQFGMQGVEMLRGTGMGARQRFDMAVEARMQAERLRFSDPVTRQLVDNVGAEAFALTQLENANRFMMSGQGLLTTASMLGGAGMGDSLSGMLGAAGAYLGEDPLNIFRLQARQGQMAASLGMQGSQLASVNMIHRMMVAGGLVDANERIDEDVFAAIYANQMGVDIETARGAVAGALSLADVDPRQQEILQFARRRADVMADNRVSALGMAWGQFRASLSDSFRSTWMETYGMRARDALRDTLEDISDRVTGVRRTRSRSMSADVARRIQELEENELGELRSRDLSTSEIDAAINESMASIRSDLRGSVSRRQLSRLEGMGELVAGLSADEAWRTVVLMERSGLSVDDIVLLAQTGTDIEGSMGRVRDIARSDLGGGGLITQLDNAAKKLNFRNFKEMTSADPNLSGAALRHVTDMGGYQDIDTLVTARRQSAANIDEKARDGRLQEWEKTERQKASAALEDLIRGAVSAQSEINELDIVLGPVDRERIARGIKSGKLDPNDFKGPARQVVERIQANSSDQVSKIRHGFLTAEALSGSRAKRGEASEWAASLGFFDNEMREAMYSDLLQRAVVGDFQDIVITAEMGEKMSGILSSMGLSEKDYDGLISNLVSADDAESFHVQAQRLRNLIGGSAMDELADSFGINDPRRHLFRAMGNNTMERFNDTIENKAVRVVRVRGFTESHSRNPTLEDIGL